MHNFPIAIIIRIICLMSYILVFKPLRRVSVIENVSLPMPMKCKAVYGRYLSNPPFWSEYSERDFVQILQKQYILCIKIEFSDEDYLKHLTFCKLKFLSKRCMYICFKIFIKLQRKTHSSKSPLVYIGNSCDDLLCHSIMNFSDKPELTHVGYILTRKLYC